MPNPITVFWGVGGQAFGFGCHFNSVKTICNYAEQKANKVFKQKCFFWYLKFGSEFSTLSYLPRKNYYENLRVGIEKLKEDAF